MPDTAKNEEAATAAEAQQDVAQASDAKAEATSTAKANDELSEDALDAVAGGTQTIARQQQQAIESLLR